MTYDEIGQIFAKLASSLEEAFPAIRAEYSGELLFVTIGGVEAQFSEEGELLGASCKGPKPEPAPACLHIFNVGPFFSGTNSYMQCTLCGKKRIC